jgi:hypothetical protein
MQDEQIIARVHELVDEEHTLERAAQEHQGLSDEEQERLQHLEEQLDQCWDLLRQRRARRDAGLDPDDATVRDPQIVEHYRQ